MATTTEVLLSLTADDGSVVEQAAVGSGHRPTLEVEMPISGAKLVDVRKALSVRDPARAGRTAEPIRDRQVLPINTHASEFITQAGAVGDIIREGNAMYAGREGRYGHTSANGSLPPSYMSVVGQMFSRAQGLEIPPNESGYVHTASTVRMGVQPAVREVTDDEDDAMDERSIRISIPYKGKSTKDGTKGYAELAYKARNMNLRIPQWDAYGAPLAIAEGNYLIPVEQSDSMYKKAKVVLGAPLDEFENVSRHAYETHLDGIMRLLGQVQWSADSDKIYPVISNTVDEGSKVNGIVTPSRVVKASVEDGQEGVIISRRYVPFEGGLFTSQFAIVEVVVKDVIGSSSVKRARHREADGSVRKGWRQKTNRVTGKKFYEHSETGVISFDDDGGASTASKTDDQRPYLDEAGKTHAIIIPAALTKESDEVVVVTLLPKAITYITSHGEDNEDFRPRVAAMPSRDGRTPAIIHGGSERDREILSQQLALHDGFEGLPYRGRNGLYAMTYNSEDRGIEVIYTAEEGDFDSVPELEGDPDEVNTTRPATSGPGSKMVKLSGIEYPRVEAYAREHGREKIRQLNLAFTRFVADIMCAYGLFFTIEADGRVHARKSRVTAVIRGGERDVKQVAVWTDKRSIRAALMKALSWNYGTPSSHTVRNAVVPGNYAIVKDLLRECVETCLREELSYSVIYDEFGVILSGDGLKGDLSIPSNFDPEIQIARFALSLLYFTRLPGKSLAAVLPRRIMTAVSVPLSMTPDGLIVYSLLRSSLGWIKPQFMSSRRDPGAAYFRKLYKEGTASDAVRVLGTVNQPLLTAFDDEGKQMGSGPFVQIEGQVFSLAAIIDGMLKILEGEMEESTQRAPQSGIIFTPHFVIIARVDGENRRDVFLEPDPRSSQVLASVRNEKYVHNIDKVGGQVELEYDDSVTRHAFFGYMRAFYYAYMNRL